MEQEFVPYKLAMKLKELGFDEPCFKYIYTGDTGNNYDHYEEIVPSKALNFNADDLCISQPTFSQAFRWFREKYDLPVRISRVSGIINYTYIAEFYKGDDANFVANTSTYEEAESACLLKLIEIVETKSE